MKKILTLLLVALLSLALIACGTNCTEHVDTNSDGLCDTCDVTLDTGDGKGEGLVFVSDSKTEFSILIANSLSDEAFDYVNAFFKSLNNFYLIDEDLQIKYDGPDYENQTEIIFGTPTNRGDAFKRDVHYLGHEGFSIEVIDNKLFVIAGGDRGYRNAVTYLEEKVFNLDSFGRNPIDELVIPIDTKYEYIHTDYYVTKFTIAGADIRNFVITHTPGKAGAAEGVEALRNAIYLETGVWLPLVNMNELSAGQKTIYLEDTKGDKDRFTEGGSIAYVKDGNLHIECEFENKFSELVDKIAKTKFSSATVEFAPDYTFTMDVRNIYYSDFGAVGDGVTDDFFAIKDCHDYANVFGHTVNADENATYYIGRANGTQSITIKTDTYWNCCSFIFDDRVIDKPNQSKAYQAPIFRIAPDGESNTLTGEEMPVSSISAGASSLGDWKPGVKLLIFLYDNTKRHYIRYGGNQNNGTAQHEIIVVNPDGTIDPETPIQWDYTTLSKMEVYPIDETPLTVSGGRKDQVDDYASMGTFDNYGHIGRAKIYTIFNNAPSEYKYHSRNISITRSNVTLKNIEHILDDNVKTSAPYTGFIKTSNCTDVIIEGMIFQKQKSFSTVGAAGTSVGMGSYEMSANGANRVTWRHCRQSNFFQPDGSIKYTGFMGTNYCKNLKFENMVSCSFDAHCGLYNGTIIDSVCEHLNFIGAGTIRYKNVTVYTDGGSGAMLFREDYGSTWCGNVIVDGLTLKTSKSNPTLSLIGARYNNHDFGYVCYLPYKIELNDAKIIRYGYSVDQNTGVRSEWEIATNHVPLHIYAGIEKYKYADISDPEANMSSYKNDYKKCNCATVYAGKADFNDTDGDGRCNNDLNPNDSHDTWCWGFKETPDRTVNANPYVATEEIYVTNCGTLKIILPSTPQFDDTELYIDGVSQK